jgi:hypothetical protein
MFVPGAATLRDVRLKGFETEWIENDGGFGQAFSFGTVSAAEVALIDRAPGALIVNASVDAREGRVKLVAIVEQLQAAGALAVRFEQSKLGWTTARWLEVFSADDPHEWHRAAVLILESKGALQSCGMHLFSLPDVRIEIGSDDRSALRELATTFNVYQLAEDPELRSGHTFTPDARTPRRLVERWPDLEYPPDHPCHNPYGAWRLGPPGGKARKLGELALTFVPALVAVLTALEDKANKPLTQKQVERARDQGACIAMKPADARALERSRGYADLDPELAWPQWQARRSLVR